MTSLQAIKETVDSIDAKAMDLHPMERDEWRRIEQSKLFLNLLRIAEELEAKVEEAEDALKFVADICDESLEYARVGTGEEVALRHAGRKVKAALAEIRGEGTPDQESGGIP